MNQLERKNVRFAIEIIGEKFMPFLHLHLFAAVLRFAWFAEEIDNRKIIALRYQILPLRTLLIVIQHCKYYNILLPADLAGNRVATER